MKKLISIIVLVSVNSAFSACTIKFDVKKEGAKTAYINGTSVSAKIRAALSSQCVIKTNVLSKKQVKKMALDNAKKRYEKLLNDSKS